MSDAAWELAVSAEMLWKRLHSNRRLGNRVVGGPIAICSRVQGGEAGGLTLHAIVNLLE